METLIEEMKTEEVDSSDPETVHMSGTALIICLTTGAVLAGIGVGVARVSETALNGIRTRWQARKAKNQKA